MHFLPYKRPMIASVSVASDDVVNLFLRVRVQYLITQFLYHTPHHVFKHSDYRRRRLHVKSPPLRKFAEANSL